MIRLVILALGLFAGASYARNIRIVGGEPTTIEEYPSTVQIDYLDMVSVTWEHFCGGIILNELHILSAAHCFDYEYYEVFRRRIRVGATYKDMGGEIVYILQEYNHPEHRVASSSDADITVLRLESFLRFSSTVQPTSILAQDTIVPANLPVIYAGWGRQEFQGPESDVLRHVQVYTVSNEECRERYSQISLIVTPNMLCAGVLDVGGRDGCQGDSGGPLYLNSNITIGVVSWGYQCAHPLFPGVNADVARFSDWIISIANELPNGSRKLTSDVKLVYDIL